jgi:hypothetical protein
MSECYDRNKVINHLHKHRDQYYWGYKDLLVEDVDRVFNVVSDAEEVVESFEHWGKAFLWAARVLRNNQDSLLESHE